MFLVILSALYTYDQKKHPLYVIMSLGYFINSALMCSVPHERPDFSTLRGGKTF